MDIEVLNFADESLAWDDFTIENKNIILE